jgi:hypothetical protein
MVSPASALYAGTEIKQKSVGAPRPIGSRGMMQCGRGQDLSSFLAGTLSERASRDTATGASLHRSACRSG